SPGLDPGNPCSSERHRESDLQARTGPHKKKRFEHNLRRYFGGAVKRYQQEKGGVRWTKR
ncbi:MAG: hypothetical protein SWC40_10290, partial [Thermodesulfobacteriota bacterium]|nr:hypothetical protein [Thermodesulfobacteriota bacterium]